jgi:hypothetical protein
MSTIYRLSTAALALGLLALPMSANAFYVGAQLGMEDVENFDDSTGTATILQVGMPLMPFIGAEFEYSSTMSEPEQKNGTKIDTTMYRAFAVGAVPAGPVNIRLRVGYQYHEWEAGGGVNADDSGSAPVYGVGVSYSLMPMTALVADYTKTELSDVGGDDLDFEQYALGVQVGF